MWIFNPLYDLLGVIVLSLVFILFWDNMKCACGFAGAPADSCRNGEELDLATVQEFFAQPEIAALLAGNKNYIGTAVRAPEDGGVTVTLSVYDTEKAQPVQSQCYRVKKLDRDLRRNFGKSEMIVVA